MTESLVTLKAVSMTVQDNTQAGIAREETVLTHQSALKNVMMAS